MKKIVSFTFLVLMVISMVLVSAYAELPAEAVPDAQTVIAAAEIPPEPTPYNWAALATVAGCAAGTLLVVQFTKQLIPDAFPTRVYVYLIALAIMMLATHFTAGLTADSVLLVVLNAFVAATSALGTYDLTFAKMDGKA